MLQLPVILTSSIFFKKFRNLFMQARSEDIILRQLIRLQSLVLRNRANPTQVCPHNQINNVHQSHWKLFFGVWKGQKDKGFQGPRL